MVPSGPRDLPPTEGATLHAADPNEMLSQYTVYVPEISEVLPRHLTEPVKPPLPPCYGFCKRPWCSAIPSAAAAEGSDSSRPEKAVRNRRENGDLSSERTNADRIDYSTLNIHAIEGLATLTDAHTAAPALPVPFRHQPLERFRMAKKVMETEKKNGRDWIQPGWVGSHPSLPWWTPPESGKWSGVRPPSMDPSAKMPSQGSWSWKTKPLGPDGRRLPGDVRMKLLDGVEESIAAEDSFNIVLIAPVHQQVYQLMTGILATADENAIAEGRQQTVNSTIVVSIGDAVGKTPPEASHTEDDDDSTQAPTPPPSEPADAGRRHVRVQLTHTTLDCAMSTYLPLDHLPHLRGLAANPIAQNRPKPGDAVKQGGTRGVGSLRDLNGQRVYEEPFSETYCLPAITDAMAARTTALLFVLPEGTDQILFQNRFHQEGQNAFMRVEDCFRHIAMYYDFALPDHLRPLRVAVRLQGAADFGMSLEPDPARGFDPMRVNGMFDCMTDPVDPVSGGQQLMQELVEQLLEHAAYVPDAYPDPDPVDLDPVDDDAGAGAEPQPQPAAPGGEPLRQFTPLHWTLGGVCPRAPPAHHPGAIGLATWQQRVVRLPAPQEEQVAPVEDAPAEAGHAADDAQADAAPDLS